MVLCFRLCVNGLVFQSVCECMVSCLKVCMNGLVFLRVCVNGLVFEIVHEWSWVSECE